MSPASSFFIVLLSFMVQVLLLPWLLVLGITVPITIVVLALLLKRLAVEATVMAVLIGGWLHDVWLASPAAGQFLAWSLVALIWLLFNRWLVAEKVISEAHRGMFLLAAVVTYELFLALFSLEAGVIALAVHAGLVVGVGFMTLRLVQLLARQLERVV